MALYHQLKFPSTFIEYRSVSEWKGVVVISNFDSLEAAPFKSSALGSCLVCLGLNSPLTIRNTAIHCVGEKLLYKARFRSTYSVHCALKCSNVFLWHSAKRPVMEMDECWVSIELTLNHEYKQQVNSRNVKSQNINLCMCC